MARGRLAKCRLVFGAWRRRRVWNAATGRRSGKRVLAAQRQLAAVFRRDQCLVSGVRWQSRQQAAGVGQHQAVESGDESPHSKRAFRPVWPKLCGIGRDTRVWWALQEGLTTSLAHAVVGADCSCGSGSSIRIFLERHGIRCCMHEPLRSQRMNDDDEPPPLLRTWPRLYLAVIAWLLFLILIFYWFTGRFAP